MGKFVERIFYLIKNTARTHHFYIIHWDGANLRGAKKWQKYVWGWKRIKST